MEEEILTTPEEPEFAQVVDIQFRPGQKVYYFDPDGKEYRAGDHVIIDTARGPEFGICAAGNHNIRTRTLSRLCGRCCGWPLPRMSGLWPGTGRKKSAPMRSA